MIEEKYKCLFTSSGKINSAIFRGEGVQAKYPELFHEIMNKFPEYDDFKDKLRAIAEGNYCRCTTCGNIMSFPKSYSAQRYCSFQCGNYSSKKINAVKSGAAWSPAALQKRQKTCLERYGTSCFVESKEFKDKQLETLQQKYGVNNISQYSEVKKKKASKMEQSIAKRLDTRRQAKKQYFEDKGIDISNINIDNISVCLHRDYPKEYLDVLVGNQTPSIRLIRENLTHAYPMLHKYNLIKQGKSTPQTDIEQFITSLGVRCESNNRKIIKPQELDIVMPDNKLAIEFNGEHWHDSAKAGKLYHQLKTEKTEEQGLQLLHIWSYDWFNKTDIVKSIIMSKLGKSNRIYARKCVIKEISNKEAREFYDKCHLKGYRQSLLHIGLVHNDKIVMCMSFSKHRTYEWELIRMANSLNTTVVGGASKILKYFELRQSPSCLMSYADRDISCGNVYQALGFEFVKKTIPSYWYYFKGKVISRSHLQKSKLENTGMSESQVAAKLGFIRIDNSGNLLYVKKFIQ